MLKPRNLRIAAATLAFGALGAGCAPIGDPELGAAPVTSSTSVPGDEPSGDETETDLVEQAVVIRDFAPARPEGYSPSLVVGTPLGLFVYDKDLAAADVDLNVSVSPLLAPVDEVSAAKIVDDFFGGLLLQTTDGRIEWFGAQGGEPIVLSETGSELLDVGFLDATGAIHALLGVDGTQIDTVRLDGGERESFVTLPDGMTLVDLSASNGLHAVVVADENCGDLLFFDATGTEVELGGPSSPVCVVARRSAYGAVALSPDRSTVAYTQLTYRSDGIVAETRLIARQLGNESDLFNIVIGGAAEQIQSLSFDGQRVTFVRSGPEIATVEMLDPSSEEPALVLDLDSPQAVTFARQRLVVGRATLQE